MTEQQQQCVFVRSLSHSRLNHWCLTFKRGVLVEEVGVQKAGVALLSSWATK